MFKRILFVLMLLFVAAIGDENKFCMNVQMKFKDVTLSQATAIERQLRDVTIFDASGKAVKVEIKIKMDD